MLQFYACCLVWCHICSFRREYLQKSIVGVIYAFPMFAEEITMLCQFCLDLLIFSYFCQPSNSYATIFISPFEYKGEFHFRVLLYLFDLFTPRVCCYPKFAVKIDQRHGSDSGLIAVHGPQEHMLKILKLIQYFFKILSFFNHCQHLGVL